MIYNLLEPEPHANLSGKAAALAASEEDGAEEKFLAEGNLAEDLLGFADISELTGPSGDKARMYLALQITWQMELGIDPFYTKSVSSTHTDQLVVYRDGITIHPYVLARIGDLIGSKPGGRFKRVVRSVR